jgi:hypothetical protein
MTNAQAGTLVFKNAAGDYFLVPQEVLEQGRVPAEHRAEVEQAIAAAQDGAGEDDVQGHILPLIFGLAAIAGMTGGFVATWEATKPTGTLKGWAE